jgi:hypothetical protein
VLAHRGSVAVVVAETLGVACVRFSAKLGQPDATSCGRKGVNATAWTKPAFAMGD